ncbi:hypothetical protein KC19_VG201400 [Ceratodon purpureus]|uniref:Uncharacterized protein n=1 Tax=Ceratodon purpureus TaxID=3225 RepID=A0A8T0HRZ1_CERPU|nr:hypothetical protein KC19_VG201400 [Ceratodon purpureus]
MGFSTIVYNSDYGIRSGRINRFNGVSSWTEQSIREYELGFLGPRHECIEDCGCVACRRLHWLNHLDCKCPLGNWRWKSLSLEDAMKRKLLRCRCQPTIESYSPEECCPCLLLLTTQEGTVSANDSEEYVGSPYGDNATLFRLMNSEGESSDRLNRPLTEREIQSITAMAQRLQKEYEAMASAFPPLGVTP